MHEKKNMYSSKHTKILAKILIIIPMDKLWETITNRNKSTWFLSFNFKIYQINPSHLKVR